MLFGLESAELQNSAMKALDTFQLKCVRKILKMKTTYVDRSNTNEEVYRRANAQLREDGRIKPRSAIYLERKQNYSAKW